MNKDKILAIVDAMSKITSKLQVTIPKAIAEEYGLKPGDDIEFKAAGDVIRVVPPGGSRHARLSVEERLRLFDESTERQRRREASRAQPAKPLTERDWKREDLYRRGEPR